MKRMITVLMALLIVLSCVSPKPSQALKSNDVYSADTQYTVRSVSEKTVSAYSDGICKTVEEAALIMREKMKDRIENVQIAIMSDDPKGEYEALYYAIVDIACEHTGNPTEGDYIASTYSGNKAQINISDNVIVYSFSMKYKTTAAQEIKLDAAVEQLIEDLGVREMNDYQKISTVYDYVCKNVTYDHTGSDDLKFTAYAALMDKTAVCQGYATLLYRLLLEAGIDNRMIRGKSYGESHAWNIVLLGGKYYNLDATMDSSRIKHAHFLTCDASLPNHSRNEQYAEDGFTAKYPMAVNDYVYNENTDAPSVTATPTAAPVPTVMPTPAGTAEPDKTKPYLYFDRTNIELAAGTSCGVTMYFGGGADYACYEILLSYTVYNGNVCRIERVTTDFANGIEELRIDAQSAGTEILDVRLLNKNRELLASGKLVINIVDAVVNTPSPTPQSGDANGDSKVNSRDIAEIQKHIMGLKKLLDAKMLEAADYNRDGKINSRDIAAINKYILRNG